MRRVATTLLATALTVAGGAVSATAAVGATPPAPAFPVAHDDYVTVYQAHIGHVDVLANDSGTDLETDGGDCGNGHLVTAQGTSQPGEFAIYVPGVVTKSVTCTYILSSYASPEAQNHPSTGIIHVTVARYKRPKLKIVKRHHKSYVKVVQTNPDSTYSQLQYVTLVIGRKQRHGNYKERHISPHAFATLPLNRSLFVKLPESLWNTKMLEYGIDLDFNTDVVFTGKLKNRYAHKK